jgi:mannose-1-phosphate guanylyltransferase
MDAVLLAGGFGTRLRPLTYTRPKPLLPVAGRPMVEWVLDRLPPDIHRVIVAVNWKAQALGTYLRDRPRRKGQTFDFVVVREEQPLGTAGAVRNCASYLRSPDFLLLNADIVSTMDLGALVAAHRAHEALATLSLKEVEPADVVHYGVVEPGGAAAPDGAIPVRGFVEKPRDPREAPSRLINAGATVLDRSVLDLIPAGRLVSMEKEVFPQVLAKGRFWGLPFQGHWIDVGDPDRLRAASAALDPSFRFGPASSVAADAEVTDSIAGEGCFVGPEAVVQRCVLGDRVTVRGGVRLADCVVGDGEVVSSDAKGARIWTRPVPAGYPDQQVGNALEAPTRPA